MKKHGTTILLILIFIVGIGLLVYPSVSDWWNSQHQSRAIASYTDIVENLDDNSVDKFLAQAEEYNRIIAAKNGNQIISAEELQIYNSVLDITGTGIMAYIEIPSIDVSLPIYHSVEDSVLQVAVGHLEWTSLPVGGKSTHCVLSGHRGLPSAKLFTNLDKLVAGDIFMLHILDTTITYQVDNILIVEPDNTDSLRIIEGGDYCTLVTCTPYGINSHRLLVRGHRIENSEEEKIIRVTADAMQIEPIIVAPVVAIPILFVLMLYLLIKPTRKKAKSRNSD